MKVMVTGGTGFVGSHTVAELLRQGHQVKLLVRSMERVRSSLEPLGVGGVEAVVGDVTDLRSVEEAAAGCEATVHCGSVYSMDPRAAETIRKTNVNGTEVVIGTAHKMGHDPIVHVSSYSALIGMKGAVLTPASAPTRPPGAYFRSKADSDLVARRYQDAGVPVVITYPGSAWGPHDPHFGESFQMLSNILHRRWIATPVGAVPITDVRDLARLHAALIEKGRGPRRYIASCQNATVKEVMAAVSAVTGRSLPSLSLPVWTLLWPMKAADAVQRLLPFRLPVNYQAIYLVGLGHRCDDSATRREFGVEARPLHQTISDTIRWMVQCRQLPRALAGRLSSEAQEM